MKLIVSNESNICESLYDDDVDVEILEDKTKVGDRSFLTYLNSTNSKLVNVDESSVPVDYADHKYSYLNGSWTISPDWVEPSEVAPSEEPAA